MPLANLKIERKEYEYIHPDVANKGATIKFEKREGKGWELEGCTFYGTKATYTIFDWKFLGELALEVQLLYHELNKP